MTIRLFNKLYQHYKDDFDKEMILRRANVTYSEMAERAMKEEEWF